MGWQTDCWNWAKANQPFELYGVQPRHFSFCEALSAACDCKFDVRPFHDESIASFEPNFSVAKQAREKEQLLERRVLRTVGV